MPLFTPLKVPRNPIAKHNPILFEGGRGAAGFFTSLSKFLGWQVIPWDNKWLDGFPSFMAPLSHYHLLQEEKFHVESGSGYWFMHGQRIKLSAVDEITIPRLAGDESRRNRGKRNETGGGYAVSQLNIR